jgi:hypothetical protein
MTDCELTEYFNPAGRAFLETGKISTSESDSFLLREDPPKSGS